MVTQRVPNTQRLGLRGRFVLTTLLLVLTTIMSGVWSALTFYTLSHSVDATLVDTDTTRTATSHFSIALEREDDALLTSFNGQTARAEFEDARRQTETALAALSALLVTATEHEADIRLHAVVQRYHTVGDTIGSVRPVASALDEHQRFAIPVLRQAVAMAGEIRDEHAREVREVAARTRDEARRSVGRTAVISLTALTLTLLVSLQFARGVVWPIRRLTRAAESIREGNFDARVNHGTNDEIGQLATTFDRMAENLAVFRAANVDEVLRAKETLEATLGAMHDAVFVVEADETVSLRNPAAHALTTEQNERGIQTLRDLPLAPLTLQHARDVLGGRELVEMTFDVSRAQRVMVEDTQHWLLARVMRIPPSGSRRVGVIVVLSDVTEFIRLDEMRAELIAVASHEFRTPLTTMRMTLSMLGEDSASLSPRGRELIATAQIGTEQLATTVDEFLDLTRIEAGQLRLDLDKVDPGALIERVVAPLRPWFSESGIELVVSIETPLPSLLVDSRRMATVISNILNNAGKYTPAHGSVSLSARCVPHALEITVTDTGPGVPETFRERIFEKFFRVEHHLPEASQGVRGAGIGLYLSRQIVAAHQGKVVCETGEHSVGARFRIVLPLPDSRSV